METPKDESLLREPWPAVDEDPVTGLPNFFSLLSDLPEIVRNSSGVVMALDIQRLGSINAQFGTETGDQVIVGFAEGLRETIAHLGLTNARAYRLGGDEFCVVIPGWQEGTDAFSECLEKRMRAVSSQGCLPSATFTLATVRFSHGSKVSDVLVNLWSRLEGSKRRLKRGRSEQVQIITQHLVRAIQETVELLKAARKLAYTDDISGLPNHRAAKYVIRECMEKCRERGTPLSLLFVDGDNLRQYNDNLGYTSGNEMIRQLGALLASETSPGDLVSRWLSGDEFMIVLLGSSKEAATSKAKSICRAVQEKTKSWTYPITVSIGIATYPDDARDLESLLRKVEEANARAKKAGKNCVSF
ncbi:MAG: diguanylate cyclase [Candidatus Fermentithermobacillus carboniphilus]|uniref:Diguanylate cyclase n=1 Tax=Candidatus Fermentithermobacillus carboniphilus TaxID=3085328 RepID=A0AAT9LDF5_9FIRM|nr:MAG: diguanylate cyclase [Candidatus Fermentithermobacillus carboniphilus]